MALPAFERGDFIGDRLQVIEKLGEGGFGIVYLARTLDGNEVVAVKTLRAELLRDAATRAMFEKEARIWIDLGAHPNLVRAKWVSEIGGRLYIGMEYVKAGAGRPNDLEGHLAKGPIETGQALLWAIQFCRGMEYAMSKGVRCHRDIKPANILIGGDSVVKISDFGIAGLALVPETPVSGAGTTGSSGPADPTKTAVGTVFGTPTHMPPEQFVDAASCDERSDVYSFGIVLYQIASGGRLPFMPPPPPPGFSAQAGAYYWHAFRKLHQSGVEAPLSSPLAAIVTRALKKKREDRYPNFAALRADLEMLYEKAKGEKAPLQQAAGENANTWNAKGISLAALGRWAEAVTCYDKALALEPKVAPLHNNRGNALRNLGRAQEALAAFDQSIALDPLYPAPWENKALLYANAQRNEEALACVDRALTLDPTASGTWGTKGVLLGRMGREAEEIEAYDQALRIDPRNGLIWFNKANSLSSTNHVAALDGLNQSLSSDPSFAPAWDLKGTLLGELGLPEEAVSCHQEAIRLAPRDWKGHYNLGNAWISLDRLEEARAAYEEATRLNPDFRTAWYNLALTTLRLGRNAPALTIFDHFLAMNPPDDGLRRTAIRLTDDLRAGRTPKIGPISKGKRIAPEQKATIDAGVLPQVKEPAKASTPAGPKVAPPPKAREAEEPLPPPRPSIEALTLDAAKHFNASRFAEALAMVDTVLKIEPRDPKALNTRANCLFRLGRKDEACAAIDRAVLAMPGDLTFWVNKAFIEKGAGKLQDACRSAIDLVEIAQVTGAKVDAVEHARRLIAELHGKGIAPAPRSHPGFLGLGFASMIAGRPDQALGHFDKAVAAAPGNADVLRWKGSALKEQRRVDEALAVYDQAIALDPKGVEAHHDRGMALAMLREFGPAVEAFDQALALDPNHVASLSDKGKYAGELGRHEEALKALRRAAALVPDHPAPWLNKGLVEELLKRDEDALQSYERFLACAKPEMRLQIEASKRKVEQLRARVAARSGVPPLAPATAAPSGAQRATAASVVAVKNLLAEDDLDDAEIERLAIALDRGDQAPLQAALKRGNERMAAQVAEWQQSSGGVAGAAPTRSPAPAVPAAGTVVLPEAKVPAVVPTASFDDCIKRAEMARNQGLFGKALEWADQAIVSDSKKHHGWLAKADALFGLRRFAEAAAHAKKATELQPGFPPAWIRLASSLDLLNAPEQALPAWDKAVELAGQNVLTWDGKGVCLAKLGRIEEALAVHEKSLAIDPRFSLGKFHKGMREADLGRKEAALKSLQQFLALAPPNLAGLVQEARKRMQELSA
jgi:tetratricopeptide (TPR) repeat protein